MLGVDKITEWYWDKRMLYVHVPASRSNENRKNKEGLKFNGSHKTHLFVYTPNEKPMMRQFLCGCNSCINFNFKDCEKVENINAEKENLNPQNEDEDDEAGKEECELDEDCPFPEDDSPVYDFIEPTTFISILSNNVNHERKLQRRICMIPIIIASNREKSILKGIIWKKLKKRKIIFGILYLRTKLYL